MAATLALTASVNFVWQYQNVLDLLTAKADANLTYDTALTNGTGAVDTADLIFTDTRTLAATTENLDLAGGLTDAFGNTLTFARIKGLFIHNTNTTAGNNLTIGGAASNAFPLFADTTDKYTIGPDGNLLILEPSAAAKAVTAGTGDILKMDAGSSTIVYKIIIVGSSA